MTIRLAAPAAKRRAAPTGLVPAAARGSSDALTPHEAVLNGEAIEMFTKAVGGRDQLAQVLQVASAAPDIDKVALYLLDPRYAQMSLRRICTLAGLTVADLFTAYRKALVARAHIEATHIIASRLTPIVADVMTRAAPHRRVCPTCADTSPAKETCLLCCGSGMVQNEPDIELQKLALELGQLIEKKGGGILMQQNTIAAGVLSGTGTGSLEQLHQAVGDLLFSPGRRRSAAPVVEGIEVATLDDELLGPDPDALPTPRVPRADRDTADSDRYAPDPDHDTDSVDSSAPPAEIGDAPEDPAPPDA